MKLFAEQRRSFPDPQLAPADGIVEWSDDLSVERLLEAYSFGIFPWPHPELPVLWHCPKSRGVIDFSDFHVPRSLQKLMAKGEFQFSFDRRFAAVIGHCAKQPRPGQTGTWITDPITQAYQEFHRAGYAHSLEVWQGEELAGGLYGVYVGGLFCGESMFYLRPNASKLALVALVEFLGRQGLKWMDIQMITPVTQSLGGKYISRREFLRRLELCKAQAKPIDFRI